MVFQLPLEVNGKVVIARNYNGYTRFYAIDKNTSDIISSLTEDNAFYGNYIRNEIPKEGSWTLLGMKPWTAQEVKTIPFLFRQNTFNYSDCAHVHPTFLEAIPVSYEQCIGLERARVSERWDHLFEELMAKLRGVPNEPWDELYRLKIPGVDKPR